MGSPSKWILYNKHTNSITTDPGTKVASVNEAEIMRFLVAWAIGCILSLAELECLDASLLSGLHLLIVISEL